MAILISILMSLGLVSTPNTNNDFEQTNSLNTVNTSNCIGWDWTNHQ